LARAFCATGDLILLDEPIAGLDPMAMTEMYGMIADLNRDGVAVVMVSHDVAAAVNYATHILHMSKTTTFFGTTEEYLATPVGQQFARREGGSYGDWSPKTAWDAPDIGKILDVHAAPDARSVLGARGVSRDKSLTANRRRGGSTSKGEGDDA
jgi:ABC-type multidrug transport system ATPase subunit